MNKLEFTNKVLDNLNDSIHEDGKVGLAKFIELTNKLYEAINYSRCCKSDSEQLNNLKNKLSFMQWKEVNNYRLTGNDLIRKGKLTFTAAEVFEQYKKYVNEIV